MEKFYKISSEDNFQILEISEKEGDLTYFKVYLMMIYRKLLCHKKITKIIFTTDKINHKSDLILLFSNQQSTFTIRNCINIYEQFVVKQNITLLETNVLNLRLQSVLKRFGWKEVKKGNLYDKKYQKTLIQ